MSERIEHQLNQICQAKALTGNVADVVRQGFGTQSDSWVGYLSVVDDGFYPLKFQFQYAGGAILFTADDVIRIDPPKNPNDERNNQPIIRLKGPQDYASQLQTTH